MSEFRTRAAATLVLSGLAAGWAALAALFAGASPAGWPVWTLVAVCLSGCGAGSLAAFDARPAAIRWVGTAGFGLGAAVSVVALLLLYRS